MCLFVCCFAFIFTVNFLVFSFSLISSPYLPFNNDCERVKVTATIRFPLFHIPLPQGVSKLLQRLKMAANTLFMKKSSRFIGAILAAFLFVIYFIIHSYTTLPPSLSGQSELVSHSQTHQLSIVNRISSPSQPTPDPNRLSIVIIASAEDKLSDVQFTYSSVVSADRNAYVQLAHFTNTPDPDFAALVPIYRQISSRRPYDNPLLALSSDSPPTLLITAGTIVAPRALQWLDAARKIYAGRPDVAAFSLDAAIPMLRNRDSSESAPDHDPAAWRPVDPLAPNDAFIFRTCPHATTIMFNNQRPHFQPWHTFYEWITARRSIAFRFPSGSGIDNTPLSMAGLTERDWTPGRWNVWFSQFLHQYHVGVVYPNVGGALVKNEKMLPSGAFPLTTQMYRGRGDWKLGEDIPTYLGSGRLVPLSYFSSETIANIVDLGKKQQGVISFTMVNKHFIDMSHSWLCNVDVPGFRPKGLVWVTTDAESYRAFRAYDNSKTIRLDEIKGGKDTGHDFGNPGYWKLMLERTELITEILNQGIAIFAFETDAIWLEDPMPYIEKLLAVDADMVGTINSRFEVSGNFFYLRPSLPTRRLWIEITNRFHDAYENAKFKDKKPDSWTYIQNDQSLLTNLVLRNSSWRGAHPLTFMTLDLEKFVDGQWYDAKKGIYSTKRAQNPVVINNNFVIGTNAKITRAKKHGHWFWDDKKKICLGDVVNAAVRESQLAS